MARATYSEEQKAAVMAALLTGQSIAAAARAYNIPRQTIQEWATHSDAYRQFSAQKRERIGDLILDYVNTSLQTLRDQVEFFGDPEWLKEQPASELAVLHGVVADKTIRILEAIATEPEPEQAGE